VAFLRLFFHWKFSGVVIPVLWAAVIAMVSIAMAFADAKYFFHWAYIFLALFIIWSLGYWLTSDTLKKRKKMTTRQRNGLDAYSRGPYYRLLLLGCILIVIVSLATGVFIGGAERRKRLESHADYLVPGNDPTPPNPCSWAQSVPMNPQYGGGYVVPRDALSVLLGPMAAISTQFPATVISIDDEPILTMDRTWDGQIAISTDIYDEHHDIIVSLNENTYNVESSVFSISRNNSLSDLVVVIRHDKEEVLNVRYLNPKTVLITGVFRTKNAVLRVGSDAVYINGSPVHIGHICSGNHNYPDFRFESGKSVPHP
jgi:hypothetical protein